MIKPYPAEVRVGGSTAELAEEAVEDEEEEGQEEIGDPAEDSGLPENATQEVRK